MGFENALSEITLVLFTTLAPSGAASIAVMALVLLFGKPAGNQRKAISKYLSIPLTVTIVGLVASATHLGNPANALYVLCGVGRSPLSNEVFSAVLFLGLSGSYWLYSFAIKPAAKLQSALLACIVLAAIAFTAFVATAYSAKAVITWNTPLTPASIMLSALVGGPLLAQLSLHIAEWGPAATGFGKAMLGISVTASTGALICYIAQGMLFNASANHVISAAELVPLYGPMVGAFFVLAALGLGLFAAMLFERIRYQTRIAIGAMALVFAGIFVMRFAFYMAHLTAGVGV